MSFEDAVRESTSLVVRVAPVIFSALVISNALYASKLFRSVLLRAGSKLPFGSAGAALAAFLLHPVVGISILSAMRRRGEISRSELTLSIALSTFPRGVRAVLLFLIPVALPTLGIEMCLKLVSLDLLSRFIIVAIVAAIFGGRASELKVERSADGLSFVQIFAVFARITMILFLSSFLVSLFFESHDGELAILVSGAMSTTAAIGIASTLMYRGLIDAERALFLLLVSRVLHVFVESARMSLPLYTSFFGVREGTRLLLVHVCCNAAALTLAALLALAL